MKKFTLLAVALLGIGSLNAQNNMAISAGSLSGKTMPSNTALKNHTAVRNTNPSPQTTLFSEDFASGLPATWSQVDSTGDGEVWTPTTVGPFNYPAVALASASAANGWMMLDDDNYGNNATFIAVSLVTPAINCSANTQVFLTLQEQFRQYLLGEGVIYVSNDNVNWTAVHNAADGLAQGDDTPNPFAPIIDISAVAANQATVYLKFTYRGDWDYFWQIDDIQVYEPSAIDVNALSVNPLNAEYTQIPLSQMGGSILTGEVHNNGTTATSGGTALFEVVDAVSSTVAFSESVNLPAIASLAASSVSTTNAFTPTAAGDYLVRMTVALAGDATAGNDILESSITVVSDSVYARDNDVNNGSLGIGAGPADGIVGQNFDVTATASLTSISFFLTDAMSPATLGSPLWATIHTQTPGSSPDNASIASTDTLLLLPGTVATGGQWFTLQMSGSPASLTPGRYYVGLHEVDSLLTLGRTDDIATPTAVWVTWNTIPSPPAVNGWASASDFGFNIAYQLRMNFGDAPLGINTETALSGFEVYPNPSNGIINVANANTGTDYSVNVYNAIGQSVYFAKSTTAALTTIDLSKQPSGVYQVKISNNAGSFNKSVVVSNK